MKKYYILSVCVLCALVMALALPVFAESAPSGNCSLTLEYIDEGKPLENAVFRMYCVAVGSPGSYDLTEHFESFIESPSGLRWTSAEQLETIAGDLTDYIADAGIEPDQSGVTDGNGQLAFRELEQGLYLVLGESLTEDGLIYTPQPILTWLPCAGPDEQFVYDLACQPKFIKDTEFTMRTVKKVWVDDGTHPASVVVQLLCDGEKYDEVTLSAESDWMYAWEELPYGHVWTVEEKEIPDGYTAAVTQDGVAFTVTNTKTPPPPQTGDPSRLSLWLTIMVISGFGLLLFAILAAGTTKKSKKAN